MDVRSDQESVFLDSVAQLLRNSLSPDPSTQRQNLEHFDGLKSANVPGIHYLARVLSLVLVPEPENIGVSVPAADPPLEIRQAAGMALKQLLQVMYGQPGNILTFQNEDQQQHIQVLKVALLCGLRSEHRNVRLACSDCISVYFTRASRFASTLECNRRDESLPQPPLGYSPLQQWSELPSQLLLMGRNARAEDHATLTGVATCVSLLTEDLNKDLMRAEYSELRQPLLILVSEVLIHSLSVPVLEYTIAAVEHVIRISRLSDGEVTEDDFNTDDVLCAPKANQDQEQLASILVPQLINILGRFLDPLVFKAEHPNAVEEARSQGVNYSDFDPVEKYQPLDKLLSIIFDCMVSICLMQDTLRPVLGQLLKYALVVLQFSEATPISAGSSCNLLAEVCSVSHDFGLDHDDPWELTIREATPSFMIPLLNALKMTRFDLGQMHHLSATNDSEEEDMVSDVDFLALVTSKLQSDELSAGGGAEGPSTDDDATVAEGVNSTLRSCVLHALLRIAIGFPGLTVTDLIPAIGSVIGSGADLAKQGGGEKSWNREAIVAVEAAVLALGQLIEEVFWTTVANGSDSGITPTGMVAALVSILNAEGGAPALIKAAVLDCLGKFASGFTEDIPGALLDSIPEGITFLNLPQLCAVLYEHTTSSNKRCQQCALRALKDVVDCWYGQQDDDDDFDSDDEDLESVTEDHHEGSNVAKDSVGGGKLSAEQLTSLFRLVDHLPNYQARSRDALYTLLQRLAASNGHHHWLNYKENTEQLVPKLCEWLQWCGENEYRYCESAAVMCTLSELVEAWRDAAGDGSDVQLLPYVQPLAGYSLGVLSKLAGSNEDTQSRFPMIQHVTKSAVDLLIEMVETLNSILETLAEGSSINATHEGSLGKVSSDTVQEMLSFIFTQDLIKFLVTDILAPTQFQRDGTQCEPGLKFSSLGLIGEYIRCVSGQTLAQGTLGPKAATILGQGSVSAPNVSTLESLAYCCLVHCREFDVTVHHKGVTNSVWGIFHLILKIAGGDAAKGQLNCSNSQLEGYLNPQSSGGIVAVMAMMGMFFTNDDLDGLFELRLNAGIVFTQLAARWPEALTDGSGGPLDGVLFPAILGLPSLLRNLEDDTELYQALLSTAHMLGASNISDAIFNADHHARMELFRALAESATNIKRVGPTKGLDTLKSAWSPIVGVLKERGGKQLAQALKEKGVKSLNKIFR